MKLSVLDTGVLVAGVFWRREPHACLKVWLNGLICPVVSDDIFAEYERVLREVKAEEGLDTDVESWLETMRASALWVTPVKLLDPVCRDPNDDKFIEAALAAGARTGNEKRTQVIMSGNDPARTKLVKNETGEAQKTDDAATWTFSGRLCPRAESRFPSQSSTRRQSAAACPGWDCESRARQS